MDILNYLVAPYREYATWQIVLEAVATIFGLLSVYFSMKKNIWVYPTGIVSTAIYVYILFKFGLLGDTMINLYYTVMSIYGWIIWAKSSKDHVHVEVSKASRREWLICGGLFIFSIGFVSMIYYFKPYIDNGFSMNGIVLAFNHLDWANYMDIVTTAIFLVGMWLMAEKKVENWIFWIIGDFICVPMMLYKELGITSIQYFIFTILAVFGYIEWLRSLKENTKTEKIKEQEYEKAI